MSGEYGGSRFWFVVRVSLAFVCGICVIMMPGNWKIVPLFGLALIILEGLGLLAKAWSKRPRKKPPRQTGVFGNE